MSLSNVIRLQDYIATVSSNEPVLVDLQSIRGFSDDRERDDSERSLTDGEMTALARSVRPP